MKTPIHINIPINNRVETVWNAYHSAEDIKQWNHASDDWHCTNAINDLRIIRNFSNRREAKDGRYGLDFEGRYTAIDHFKRIAYTMTDRQTVDVTFHGKGNHTN